MTVSELIQQLGKIYLEQGDLAIGIWSSDMYRTVPLETIELCKNYRATKMFVALHENVNKRFLEL